MILVNPSFSPEFWIFQLGGVGFGSCRQCARLQTVQKWKIMKIRSRFLDLDLDLELDSRSNLDLDSDCGKGLKLDRFS